MNPYKALDNNSEHVFAQILEPLYKTNEKGEVEPWLATKATPSDNFKTWTLQLRKGVEFSDGKPMSAEDVVYSLDQIRTNVNWEAMFTPITSVEAKGSDEVVIKCDKPFPTIETNLSLPFAAVVPKNLGGESAKQFGNSPIGTGPFQLSKWVHGTALTLVANPHYWKPKEPVLEELTFETVESDNSRALQLRSGQLDIIATPPLSQVGSLENTPNIHLGKFGLSYPDYLMFNVRSGLFADPKMREAADLVVDRNGIVEAALSGVGAAGGSWFAPSLRFHDASIKAPPKNVAKAKALVAEAEGSGESSQVSLKVANGEEYARLAAQIIQESLGEIGLTVSIETFDEASLLEQVSGGEFEATLFGLTSDIVEPSEVTAFYVGLEGFWTGADTTRISQLLEEANAEPNTQKRQQRYYEIQQIVAEQKELLPLDYRYWIWGMQNDVSGFELSPTGVPWFGGTGLSS
jgi:peptide/nickel transport system substrate-binding protein